MNVSNLIRFGRRLGKTKCWHATCTMTGVRIAATSTMSPTSAIPMLPAASPSSVSFQAELANSSDRAAAENGSTSAGSKANSAASAASRPASKPEKAQPLSNDSTIATAPVPPATQETAPAKDSLAGQENDTASGNGSSNAAADAQDFRVTGSSPDPSPQIPATQPKADASRPAGTAPQSSGIATSPDKGVDAAVRADALTTPPASDAAATLEATAQAGVGIAAQSVGENFRLQMAPSAAAMIPSKGDLLQPTGKSAQKNTADAAGAKNSDTATRRIRCRRRPQTHRVRRATRRRTTPRVMASSRNTLSRTLPSR